jgi:hypothetical protein
MESNTFEKHIFSAGGEITCSLCEPVVHRHVQHSSPDVRCLVTLIQFTPNHPYCLKPVSLSSPLPLCLPSRLCPRFPTKFLYEFCFSLLRMKRPANIRHLDSVAEMLQIMKLSVMQFYPTSSYLFLL